MPDELQKKEFFKIGLCGHYNDQSFWFAPGKIHKFKIDNEKELFISMEIEGYITISIGYRKSQRDYTDYIH